jgi:L-asparaginase II
MDANPVLIEQTRGGIVENRHRGAFVISDADGRIVASAGDIARPVFPRSAIKSMQAMALVTSGAVERFGITEEQLALACASHGGQDFHVEGVGDFLAEIGLSAGDLACGTMQPLSHLAREALKREGREATPLNHMCSGKHTGMLAVALSLEAPPKGYEQPGHPAQQMVRTAIETIIGEPLNMDRCGIDGCSVPTWAASLAAYARGFARMATGAGLPQNLAAAAHRVFNAATGYPLLVAGTGMFDSVVMEAFKGRVMQKGGADGVQCGAIRDKGLGYALKIDDGSGAASQVLVANLLMQHADPDEEQRRVLQKYGRGHVRNVRGLEVGELRLAGGVPH